jgi:hypothetical protein
VEGGFRRGADMRAHGGVGVAASRARLIPALGSGLCSEGDRYIHAIMRRIGKGVRWGTPPKQSLR